MICDFFCLRLCKKQSRIQTHSKTLKIFPQSHRIEKEAEPGTMDSFQTSSQPSVSPLPLALAALFGASVMAISAFYLHKRSVDQVLDRLINLRQKRHSSSPGQHQGNTDDGEERDGYSSRCNEYVKGRNEWYILRMRNGLANNKSVDDMLVNHGSEGEEADEDGWMALRRVSSSMPNVTISNEWAADAGNKAESSSLDHDLNIMSSNLPPLRTQQTSGRFSSPLSLFIFFTCFRMTLFGLLNFKLLFLGLLV